MTPQFWRDSSRIIRTCSRCGDPWTAGQFSCPHCRSIIFLEEPEPVKIPEDTKPQEARGWD